MTDQPASIPPFTKAMMLAEAGDVLEQWLDGYTYPADAEDAAGHQQRRMRTARAPWAPGNLDALAVVTTVTGEGEPVRKYRITLTVSEVLPEAPEPAGEIGRLSPSLDRQDNELIGLDIDVLLASLRLYAARGERVPAELIRRLDSWMTRGLPMPKPWRHGQMARLRGTITSAIGELEGVRNTLQRHRDDLHDLEIQGGQQ
jgi:hypothetical protein